MPFYSFRISRPHTVVGLWAITSNANGAVSRAGPNELLSLINLLINLTSLFLRRSTAHVLRSS